jgi:16S rRNA (guanine966-N2)-methyltransferase
MRVIAGQWRGRKLVAPAGAETRPTADRTRETLFSMLASRLGTFEGLRVADLYAGSGALGIEALSRGAGHCTFVDKGRDAVAAIRDNLAKLGADPEFADVNGCAVETFRSMQGYDLILADPPYSYGARSVIDQVANHGLLAPGGWLAIETERGNATEPGPFEQVAERDVGRARLLIFRG